MKLYERTIHVSRSSNSEHLLRHILGTVQEEIPTFHIPVRLVFTRTDPEGFHGEMSVLDASDGPFVSSAEEVFTFRKRPFENHEQFTAVFIVPTGIGAEIGGHSGDSGAAAKLIASVCDVLITHPNVANAADINELPENTLYVEGSVISQLMMGTVSLRQVRSNRVMVVAGPHHEHCFIDATINAVSAARASWGFNCPCVVKTEYPLVMRSSYMSSGRASGSIEGLKELCELLNEYRGKYDALALCSLVEVPPHFHSEYFLNDNGMVNPWGGVEAMLTHSISMLFRVPSAHSPMMSSREVRNLELGVVDPRKAAETVSTTYLQSVLKGLHKSPMIVPCSENRQTGITTCDISCLVIPYGCLGLPTLAAMEQGIPVIAVRENRNLMRNELELLPFEKDKLIVVDSYLEAAGVICALKEGISLETLRRPITYTPVHEYKSKKAHLVARLTDE